jgi:hypothetical protein
MPVDISWVRVSELERVLIHALRAREEGLISSDDPARRMKERRYRLSCHETALSGDGQSDIIDLGIRCLVP